MTRTPSKRQLSPEQDRIIYNVVVHRKDIEGILRAIEARGLRVALFADGQKYRDLPEVVHAHGSHVNELEFHGHNEKLGSVSLLLANGQARIRAGGSFVARELQHELSLFLLTRRSMKKRIFAWDVWRALSMAAFMAEFILLFLEPVRGDVPHRLHVLLWIAFFIWPVFRAMSRLLHPVEIENPDFLTAVHR
jgi:hypothetical protein